jgi:hypothetical protein
MTGSPTADPGVRAVLRRLVDGQGSVLGDDLVGSYLFGSAADGGFEPDISDVDTVAVLRSDPTREQLALLDRLHGVIVDAMPEWSDRIEAVYVSSDALSGFRSATFPAARISPGEPFHAIELDDRWLIDWYQLRTVGLALRGPPATSVVPPISRREWVEAVRRHLLEWPVDDSLATSGDRAYAILSMCRGLRTCTTGEQVSKREAARWACHALPDHSSTIEHALVRRSAGRLDRSDGGSPARDDAVGLLRHVLRLVATVDASTLPVPELP